MDENVIYLIYCLSETKNEMYEFDNANVLLNEIWIEGFDSMTGSKENTLKRKSMHLSSEVQSEERPAKRRRTCPEEEEASQSDGIKKSTVSLKRKAEDAQLDDPPEAEPEQRSVKRSRPDPDEDSSPCFFHTQPGVKAFQKAQLSELYHLGDLLGEGGSAAVFEGVEKLNGRKVAIKIVHKRWNQEYITRPGDTRRLPAEVALMELVCTPPCNDHIIQLIKWEETPDDVILVLERFEPCLSLWEFCDKQRYWRISEDQAKIIMQQVVSAALHCHKRGVFHRDIKSENILLNPDTLDVKLIDFGCGDLLMDTPYTENTGTQLFLPPEVFSCRMYYAEPTTVWSLGVLLYRLLCGEIPFYNRTEIIDCQISFPGHLSKLSCDLIRTCLQSDAKSRPAIEKILDHDWFRKPSTPPTPSIITYEALPHAHIQTPFPPSRYTNPSPPFTYAHTFPPSTYTNPSPSYNRRVAGLNPRPGRPY